MGPIWQTFSHLIPVPQSVVMQTIKIIGSTPDWEDDVLSLSVRARAVGWPLAAALTAVLFVPAVPGLFRIGVAIVAGLMLLVLNMDAGWRQKQAMDLRRATEVVSNATGLPEAHVRPALLAAALDDRTIMHGGQRLLIEREDRSFTVTVVHPRLALA